MISNGKLDDTLLKQFMTGFYGYGNWDADVWFVGMEEGGGRHLSEIEKRLLAWEELGKRDLVDVRDYHNRIEVAEFFRGDKPVLQSTWRNLIRLLFSMQGHDSPTVDLIRDYQASQWGRSSGETCLIEIYPLPSPSTRDWKYAEWSSLPCLVNRTVYHYSLYHERADFIRSQIETSNPSKIIFYGFGYNDLWEGIAGTKFKPAENPKLKEAGNSRTHYYIIPHPVAHGFKTVDVQEIGRYIRNNGLH